MKKILVLVTISMLLVLCGCNMDIAEETSKSTSKATVIKTTIKEEIVKVYVQDLLDMEKEAAIILLNENSIKYSIGEKYDESTKLGHVVSQSILPETELKDEDVINLVISKGSEFVSIPNITAMTKEESISVLEKNLLNYDIVELYNSSVNNNWVINQEPKTGHKAKIGDTITIFVSLGNKQVLMEDLVNHSEAYVKAFFSELNLECNILYEQNNTVEEGLVISQSIAKNKYVNEGEIVDIVISDGLVLFEIEDYRGKSDANVKELLNGMCNVEVLYGYNFDYEEGDVISQNIEAGAVVSKDDIIVITINKLDERPVYFEDVNFEILVRSEAKKPIGQLFFSDVKDITSINNYSITHDKIQSIKGIENLKSLTSIHLYGENISDVSPLANLTDLKSLYIGDNNIEDISVLNKLVKMESISIPINPITDISVFENMKGLTKVYIYYCPINSISVLKDYTDMEALSIHGTNINEDEAKEIITTFHKLESLQMSDMNIGDFEFLNCYESLKYLTADNCEINNIDELAKFKYIVNLRLYDNQVKDISVLKEMTRLKYLMLTANDIVDISPVENLLILENLTIGDNKIEDLSPIVNLVKIEELFVSSLLVTDFSPISNLVKLERLYISRNIIDNVEFLNNKTQLQFVELHSTVIDKSNYDEIVNILRDNGCEVRD